MEVQDDGSLLLVTHVAIRQGPNGPQIDDQTAAGITQWCQRFDRVTYYGISADGPGGHGSSTAWTDTNSGLIGERAELKVFPRAYGPVAMLQHYRAVRSTLRQEIAKHRYLSFTIGGLFGDWPALAGVEAIRQKRRFSAKLDVIEPTIIRNKVKNGPLTQKLAAVAVVPTMEYYTRFILRRSAVALLQGMDTFNHYSPFASDPHCTYNTHTHVADQISAQALAEKQARILAGAPLRIVYVGRANTMKGSADWLGTLDRLQKADVPFHATWLGDGPDLGWMQDQVSRSGLAGNVYLPGFENRRNVLLQALRDSDILLFCHKTAESARCLVESLVCGCALVGYGTAYPRGLVNDHGGGIFAVQDDVAGLAEQVIGLHKNRAALSELVAAAAMSGQRFNEDMVYAHRAALMKRA